MTVHFLENAPSDEDSSRAQSGDQVLVFTDKAVEMLRRAAEKENSSDHGLRVGVIDGGCSGMRYHLAFEAGPKEQDSVLEVGGVPVFIDDDSRQYLQGMTIDYATGLHDAGFKFVNPNASRTCGCGSSFATEDNSAS